MTLIARLEAAAEGSRELDAEIAVAVRWLKSASGQPIPEWADKNFPQWRARPDGHVECVHADGSAGPHWAAPHLSTSLDAALSLVPAGHCWEVKRAIQCRAVVWSLERDYTDHAPPEGYGPEGNHPALAVCIASLKARGVA